MLPQCSHITRKRGVYYYRRRLPRPHQGEVALSLRTRNFREAEHVAMFLDRSFQRAIRKISTTMSTNEIKPILQQYLRDALEADLQQHYWAKPGKGVYTVSSDPDVDPIEADLEILGYLESEYREWLARREIKHVEPKLSKLMAEHGLADELRVPLGLGMLQANIQVLEAGRERLLGAAEPIVLEPSQAQPAPAPIPLGPVEAEVSSPLLTDVLPPFLEYMVSEKGWRGQTLAQNRSTYRLIVQVCGNKPVQSYTRRDLTKFYDTLRGLPSLWAKKPEWKDLPLTAIVERTSGQSLDRMTMKTIKRHFSALGGLFTYLKRRGEYVGENPAHGFEFPQKGRASSKRRMWEGEKLAALFSSPVWTGCQSASRRSRPGDMIIKDEFYWLPLLGLYHGNRLEEFCQLRRGDIRNDGGIWFFDINDEGDRQLKNNQSARRVPVHPAIMSLGFVDYVETVAPGPDDRVFPNLKPGGPDRKFGYYFSKQWTQYRRDVGVYEKGLDYHSFRHGVTTKLYAARVNQALIDVLTGHEGLGTSQTSYLKANELPLAVLYEAISKVDWPTVTVRT